MMAYSQNAKGERQLACLRSRALVVVSFFAFAAAMQARVVRITLQEQPQGSEARRGVPETYRVLQGRATGELDPKDPHNRILQDIDLAMRNTHGKVEYTATFTLYAPVHPAPNAVLLYEVVNRGGSIMPREYTNGDYFLQSGWQGDIPFGGRAISGAAGETVVVPIAQRADGSPITGPVVARFFDLPAGQSTLALAKSKTYSDSGVPPTTAALTTETAQLVTKRYEDIDGAMGGVATVPSDEWTWADCTTAPFPGRPDATKICLKGGADSALFYEPHSTAKDPLVLGVGL